MEKEMYKIRLDKWRKQIYKANICGMKKTGWYRINWVSTKPFYYWQKRVRDSLWKRCRTETVWMTQCRAVVL